MQTAVVNKASTRAPVAARPARAAVVVHASAQSRRAVLSGFLGAASLVIASKAQALSDIDLFDDRKARENGFDIIYEARDLDLPQNVREGFTQARSNIEETKKRVQESEKRIDSELEPFIKKAYWTEAREDLRRQVGFLRFDLNTLASVKPKEEKKKALGLRKEFFARVEDLDLSLRKKDQASALTKLNTTKAALDTVLAAVL